MLDQMAVLKGITGKGERKSVVETLLNQTNLWAVRDKAIAGFSGGMRQRFGIAQALIGNPELIIVDEPTAGLDPEERNRFLNLLAGIGDNVVVILSTHIVDDVADLCPLMAVLANGRLQLEGKPADLIASTRGKVWKKAIDHAELEQYQAEPRGDLDPAVRRQHDRPRPLRHAAARASSRSRAGSRTSISRPSPRFAAQPERRSSHAARHHRIRNPLPASQPGVLGRDRDLLPARLRPHRERECQHRHARRGP